MKPHPLRTDPPVLYRGVIGVLRPVLRTITRQRWSGGEHLPTSGGFIVAANHYSEYDPLVTAHFLVDHGHAPLFLAKSTLFDVPVFGAALRNLGQVPVYRGSSRAGDALVAAAQAIEEGACLAITPEGTLTRDPDLWPMRARPGVGRLALQTGAPVIPVAQWGAQEVLGRYARRPGNILRRPVVQAQAGSPVDLTDLRAGTSSVAAEAEATRRIMAAITDQLAGLRGQTPPPEPWDPSRQRPGEEA